MLKSKNTDPTILVSLITESKIKGTLGGTEGVIDFHVLKKFISTFLCISIVFSEVKSYKTLIKLTSMNMKSPGSESNTAMSTFDGVDVMGKRLADEVCNPFSTKTKASRK